MTGRGAVVDRGVCSSCRTGRHDRCPAPTACKCTNCPGTDTTGETERLRKRIGTAPVVDSPAPAKGGVVVWEDPPMDRAGPRARVFSQEVEDELRKHPGKWARVKTFEKPSSATSAAARYRKGESPHLKKGDWELVARRVDGGSALWARYVGKAS